MTKIGRERGWPPVQRQDFDAGRTRRGALFVGSPAEVTEKILFQHEIFHHDRFLLQLSVGTMPHRELLRAIELYDRWAIPSPGLPLFEGAFAAFSPHSPAKVDTRNSTRGPLLVTAGGKDHTVPPAISRSTVKLYRHSSAVTDHREFPDRGHSLTIDSGWRDVADAALHWLKEKGL